MADQQQPPVQPQASFSQPPSQTTESQDQQQAQVQGQSEPQPQTETSVKQEPDATNPDLDIAIEQEDIDMNNGENTAGAGANANGEGGNDGLGNPLQEAVPTSVDALAAAAAPSKKETSLKEFLGKMDDYAPIIPDAVTAHYLTLAGLPPPGHGPNQTPPHLARLLSLAAQKFIADIAADSYQYARIRASNSSSASNPMGSLNAASGLVPGAGAGAGAAGGSAGVPGESGKGKAGTHLGIQRPGFGGGGSGGSGQGRTVLTMEDLGMAVGEYGVSIKRGEFYR